MGTEPFRKRIGYIDGRDRQASPPLTVKRINLWDGAPRRKVVGKLRHGTRVQVIDRLFFRAERRWYYRVQWLWKRGWISAPFLSEGKPEVLGDLV